MFHICGFVSLDFFVAELKYRTQDFGLSLSVIAKFVKGFLRLDAARRLFLGWLAIGWRGCYFGERVPQSR